MKVNAVYQLLDDPIVYLSIGTNNWSKLPVTEKPGFVLCHAMWFFGPSSVVQYRRHAEMLRKKNFRLVMLHNSRLEERIGRLSGIPGRLLNHNMHVCEHWFRPVVSQIRYDAIYTAAARAYKRIHLALDVRRLFVLTYFWPELRNQSGKWDLELFDARLSGVAHNTDYVAPSDVPSILCSAQCGLALSRIEGAMFASMEYLLCGLPVVTTWNLGGRDYYFDESNSIHVAARRGAVKDGVARAPRCCATPAEIRRSALVAIQRQRHELIQLVSELTGRADVETAAHRWWAPPTGIDGLLQVN